MATKQLLNPATASKRTSDTQTLLFEFAFNKPSSTRAIQAIARMNFLHSPYQKSGKILDADMLYTLSLFALEPVRWINRYEWRTLTDLELCASGTFWKAMGDAMHISFEVLPSGRTGWKDGRHWLAEVNDWSIKYESDNMVPSHLSNRLAKAQMSVLFMNLPATLNGIAMKAVSFIQGDRLRKAMMFPELSAPYMTAFKTILLARKYLLRYLALPRLELMRMDYLPVESNSGRYNMQEWVGHPWYIKPTFKRRWGPGALMTRFLGGKVPGDGGNRYLPQGFLVSEIGPDYFRGEGVQATTRTKAELEEMKRGGCPFRIV